MVPHREELADSILVDDRARILAQQLDTVLDIRECFRGRHVLEATQALGAPKSVAKEQRDDLVGGVGCASFLDSVQEVEELCCVKVLLRFTSLHLAKDENFLCSVGLSEKYENVLTEKCECVGREV